MIEQLIVSATNAAFQKAQEMIKDEMSELTGGMNLPGLDQLTGG
jgi:DNA-binding protein YbaB